MSGRRIGLLGLSLWFGILTFGVGMSGLLSGTTEYDYPVYISQEFELYGESSKTITGQLTNRTTKDIVIETLYISINTRKEGNTTYYSKLTYNNIKVPANGTYNFKHSGINKSFVSAHLSYCIINGEKCFLKYSNDGVIFESSKNQQSSSIMFLIIGIILLGLSGFIVIDYFNKKNKIKY